MLGGAWWAPGGAVGSTGGKNGGARNSCCKTTDSERGHSPQDGAVVQVFSTYEVLARFHLVAVHY